jgi:hypothetical protein
MAERHPLLKDGKKLHHHSLAEEQAKDPRIKVKGRR